MRAAILRRGAAAKGFTLIESVVALAILALSLTAVYQIFGWTLRRAADQRQRDQAWLTAQSLLDLVRIEGPVAPSRRNGKTPQGRTWEIAIEPFSQQVGATSAVVQVTVKVSLGEQPGRQVELRSLEFGATR